MKIFAAALAAASAAAADYNLGHHQSHSHYPYYHNDNFNPWANSNVANPTSGWYSPYQQYSTPKVAYHTGPLQTTEYAQCNTEFIKLQFAQAPGHPMTVKYKAIAGLTPSVTYNYQVHVHTNYDDCNDLGGEFWPLKETSKFGKNPYQDPKRGKIPSVKANSTGNLVAKTETNVLLNLSGDNSIIGRSVAIIEDGVTDFIIDCCTIGYDKNPYGTTFYPSYSHTKHGYGHGYGLSYGNQYATATGGYGYGSTTANHGHKHGSDYGTHSHS